MKVIRYNISNRSEECQCPACGFGLFIDDYAYQIAPDGEAGFCSRRCADAWEDASIERILRGAARDLVALSKIRAGETA